MCAPIKLIAEAHKLVCMQGMLLWQSTLPLHILNDL